MKIRGYKRQLTLQNHFKTGTDIDQMLEIGRKIAGNNPFATLSVTGIKKPLDNQGVKFRFADRTVSSHLTQTPIKPSNS